MRDALWFFPAGHGPFDLRTDHVAALLDARDECVQLLGIELAGRLGVLASVPRLGRWAQENGDGPRQRAGELALSRLGLTLPTQAGRVQALSQGSPEDLLHALRLIAATGQTNLLPFASYLQHAGSTDAATARLAWCLATLADPAAAHAAAHAFAHAAAMAPAGLDADLRHRVLALAGYPQGLIAIVGGLVRIPMEVNALPIDLAERERALRQAVLAAFRAAHVGVTNDADRCAWEPAAMLAEPDPRKSPRLRFGRGLAQAEPRRVALGAALHLMTPWMCRALYIEQSAQAKRAFARDLSAYANARTQLDAIGMSGWLEDAAA